MFLNLTFFLVGAGVAASTLRDVFHTVVVPGESRGILRVARRLFVHQSAGLEASPSARAWSIHRVCAFRTCGLICNLDAALVRERRLHVVRLAKFISSPTNGVRPSHF